VRIRHFPLERSADRSLRLIEIASRARDIEREDWRIATAASLIDQALDEGQRRRTLRPPRRALGNQGPRIKRDLDFETYIYRCECITGSPGDAATLIRVCAHSIVSFLRLRCSGDATNLFGPAEIADGRPSLCRPFYPPIHRFSIIQKYTPEILEITRRKRESS
jgi:hypothetical protein